MEEITETSGLDLDARGGDDIVRRFNDADTIHGRSGEDTLFGDVGLANIGSDTLFGEGGRDELVGERGSNEYFGGTGGDTIRANLSAAGDTETISAGPGNDGINAGDGLQDNFDCGSGKDVVDLADPNDLINGIPASQVNDDPDPGANNTTCELVRVIEPV